MVGEAFARNCCLSLQFLKEQKYFYIRYIKTFIWGGKGTCTYLLMGEICPSSKFAWAHNKIIISVLCFSSGYLLPLQILSSSFCIFSLSLFNMLEKILISFLVWEWGKAQKELVTERKAGLWSHPPSGEFQMLRSDVVSKYPAVKHWDDASQFVSILWKLKGNPLLLQIPSWNNGILLFCLPPCSLRERWCRI